MAFDWFKKKPIDRVEGGEVDIGSLSERDPGEKVAEKIEQSENELREKERRDKVGRFIARISSLYERIELLERKMNRVESRLGIKDESEKRE
jgi:hypothetical protein